MDAALSLDDALEQLSLLLEELGITSGLFYQALLPTMTALRSGRSPQAIALAEKLQVPQDYLSALQGILPEFKNSFSRWKQRITDPNSVSALEGELAFYQQFQETAASLLQKLTLIAQEGRLSPLGKLPIQDAWEEIERMVR